MKKRILSLILTITMLMTMTVTMGAPIASATTPIEGVAPSTAFANDGKITGTTSAMEYKLATATDYIPATDGQIIGLSAGYYKLRLNATAEAPAGPIAYIQVPLGPNLEQSAPIGLQGVKTTTGENRAK